VANVGMFKQAGGGDRVSTISLLGCSTSVTLATGPTDEEEETWCLHLLGSQSPKCSPFISPCNGPF